MMLYASFETQNLLNVLERKPLQHYSLRDSELIHCRKFL